MTDPKFKIILNEKKHEIRDEENNFYGSYETSQAAEENAQLWRDYYAAPLVF